MLLKRFLFIPLALLVSSALYAQITAADTIAASFHRAESRLVLLRNERQLVPLHGLDTLRVAVVPFGLPAGDDFEYILSRYTEVSPEVPPAAGGEAAMTAWLTRLKGRYNLVIIGLDESPGEAAWLPYSSLLERLATDMRCVVAVFGDGDVLRRLPALDAVDGLILTPLNGYAYSLAAQLIFGGVGATARLAADISGQFTAGAGLDSEGGQRLRFSPPEVAGMDGALLRDSVRAIVKEGIARGAYPGAQVVVVRNGHVVLEEAIGFHTYDSLQPVTLDDVYDFASLTKISASLPAVMKLTGEGIIDLDAPWSRYYLEFRHSNKADLTLRRLLTHSARLRAWISFWQGTLKGNARYPWRKRWDSQMINEGRFKNHTFHPDSSARYPVRITGKLWLDDKYKGKILKAIRKSPLNKEPGYVYSDLSFYLWPEIIPRLTGQEFETYLKQTFYRPLGAYTMTYNAYHHFPAERIVPTERDTFFRLTLLQGTVHDEGAAMLHGVSGHAGLFGSANDLAKLMQLYLNKGMYGGKRYIADAAVEEFTRYQYPEEGLRRGIGFDKPLLEYNAEDSYVAQSASPASYGHTGYTGTFTWADPDNGLLLIMFTNRVYPTRDNRKLITMKFRPRLHQACYDAIRE